jgi:hypothetical protein
LGAKQTKVTHCLPPQRNKKKNHHARQSSPIRFRGPRGSPPGLRVTGRRRQRAHAASASFSMAHENATPAERLKIWADFPQPPTLLLIMSDRSPPRNQPASHMLLSPRRRARPSNCSVGLGGAPHCLQIASTSAFVPSSQRGDSGSQEVADAAQNGMVLDAKAWGPCSWPCSVWM